MCPQNPFNRLFWFHWHLNLARANSLLVQANCCYLIVIYNLFQKLVVCVTQRLIPEFIAQGENSTYIFHALQKQFHGHVFEGGNGVAERHVANEVYELVDKKIN